MRGEVGIRQILMAFYAGFARGRFVFAHAQHDDGFAVFVYLLQDIAAGGLDFQAVGAPAMERLGEG